MKPHDAPLPPPGAEPAVVTAYRGGRASRAHDWLADELPVALVFNGISHAVMLATPADLPEFALGFALTEGIVQRPGEVYDIEVEHKERGIEVHLDVAAACAFRLRERRRTLAGRTGCGLCGTESLEQMQRPLPPRSHAGLRVRADAVARALKALRAAQVLQQCTGAVHAAAWCGGEGDVRLVREDVGRHNALDKLVGALAMADLDAADGFFCVTSRASFEMVQKAAMAGVSMLVAISAPTAMAVRTAQDAGVALAGFARDNDLVAYAQPERFGLAAD